MQYSLRIVNTVKRQPNIQISLDFKYAVEGAVLVVLPNMVTRVRRVVTQRAILPGTRSGGMKRDSREMQTSIADGMKVWVTCTERRRCMRRRISSPDFGDSPRCVYGWFERWCLECPTFDILWQQKNS